MIDDNEKIVIARDISNIIYKVHSFKYDWDYGLSPQQKEEMDEILSLLKKVLGEVVE